MIVKEYLSWNLDRPNQEWQQAQKELSREEYQEWHTRWFYDHIQRNIEFVHSLGLKCDCVGWSSLDLSRPDAGEILDKIEAFCKEEGWLARGGCSRWYEDFESDWYELVFQSVEGVSDYKKVPCEASGEMTVKELRAYQNKGAPGLYGYGCHFVSEHFRDACIRHNVPGVRFCWARDTGRYASEQYFTIYADKCLPKIACDRFLRYEDTNTFWEVALEHHPGSEMYRRLEILGGHFPRIAEIFYNMGFHVPDHYPVSELPEEGFAHVYWAKGGYFKREKLLIHKKTAEMLIEEKVLGKKHLQPVLLYHDNEVPPGYYVEEMHPVLKPHQSYIDQMQSEYEAFIKIPRPIRRTTPKEAVKLLRKAKTARKTDFQKRMKKEAGAALEDTRYASLVPYYLVADGGNLSDEYCLLSSAESQTATAEFAADMAKEELLEQPIEGVVFVRCADGDRVILCPDGVVNRVSHEVPEVVEDWSTLAQFFADCIELEEEN